MKKIYIVITFLICTIQLSAKVYINEVMSSNSTTIQDADGDFSDWVELYNDGTSAVNLDGYFLSDSKKTPNKWMMPNVSIPAKA